VKHRHSSPAVWLFAGIFSTVGILLLASKCACYCLMSKKAPWLHLKFSHSPSPNQPLFPPPIHTHGETQPFLLSACTS